MLACLFVPLFPLAARLRSEPELKGEAVAVFEGNGNAARVVAASRPARRAGLQPGMTLPQARALLPGLIARARDRESERAAQEALLEIADSFSPRVEDAGDGVVYLDLDGLPCLRSVALVEPGSTNVGEGLAPSRNVALGNVGEGLVPSRPVRAATRAAPTLRKPSTDFAGGREGRPYISGMEHGDPKPEISLARDLIAAAEKISLSLRVGIASSKLAARVAACLPESPTVVPAGEEASFLAPLPLEKLAPQIEIAETLALWGIRSIGDFARLPEGEVASRLGELGRELHATARGFDPRPLEPRLPPPSFSEGMDLEWPLVSLEPFLFLGNAALERLAARLDSQGLACSRLEITLKLDPDGCDARAIQLPAPTRETKTLLTLVRLELEARPPGAPVTGFAFAAHPDRPRRAQLSLFGPAALSPDRLATTIARLAALLGADRVGSPRTVDGHRPERFSQIAYAPPPPPALARPPKAGRGLLAIRVLRPPVPLEVLTASAPVVSGSQNVGAGLAPARPVVPSSTPALSINHQSQITNSCPRPVSLKSVNHSSCAPVAPSINHQSPITNPSSPSISGSIKVASGPWSLEDSWWSDTPTDRDYWDIELTDGALYRIYRDRQTNAWFADGIYD